MTLVYVFLAIPLVVGVYGYAVYPLLLWSFAHARRPRRPGGAPAAPWPFVSICVPVHNEAAQVRALVESLLRVDYPASHRQIVIVSDASTDGTDEIVREYADAGVELIRIAERRGKTAAENAVAPLLRGEVVVNTDASIRLAPDAVKHLVAALQEPGVGVASGRDVSVARDDGDPSSAEAGYVGYEMWVRALETRLGGIIGASGSLYAIRADLHRRPLPEWLSRDFNSALLAREQGYRAVSVDAAVCYVPRTSSLRREYRRKVRTMAQGMATVLHQRHLLNPLQHGLFAWKLFSHKVCRWAAPALALPAIPAGLLALAVAHPPARWGLVSLLLLGAAAAVVWWWPERSRAPGALRLPAAVLVVAIATLHALLRALRGGAEVTWEPTRRETVLHTRPER